MSLSRNEVYQGDCVEKLTEIDGGTIDLVFADPPFNIGYSYDVYDDEKQTEDYLEWCKRWMRGVHRVLKPTGTFWLAIGDEYAAELKIEAQKIGFHCRSWVIWYYTFGVNCVNGFSRSHTHLFHFVKDPKKFTFNRLNPQIRVKSARELVYADNRANPNGRLPDNTWIIRPQDASLSFSPSHDMWYFARVAGTFKEREGFHGCQMPEQLLARIIRASSNPLEVVLDPFGGSGTTMCVAKKLGRSWIGFELSEDYVKYIHERLERTDAGDLVDGPEDPIQSAPSTSKGKQKKKQFDASVERAVIDAFVSEGNGYPADYLMCDKELNAAFVGSCLKQRLGGTAYVWNRYLLQLRKTGKLPQSTNRPPPIVADDMDRFGFAAEIAWRILSIDYRKTLDDILCSPEFAAEFDRLAMAFNATREGSSASSADYRRAALSIRKRSKNARKLALEKFAKWMKPARKLESLEVDGPLDRLEIPGVFVVRSAGVGFYVGESENIRVRVEQLMANERWRALGPDSIAFVSEPGGLGIKYGLKAALVRRESSLLNCRLLVHGSEL